MVTGVEVFGAVAAATTLIEICAKVGFYLNDFKGSVKQAHTFATDLQFQMDDVWACAMTVQRAARSREAGPGEQDEQEIAIWKTINRTLDHCRKEFESFCKLLEKVAAGNENLNWLRKALLQCKIDIKEPKLRDLEKKIDRYLIASNTAIHSLHLIIQTNHNDQIITVSQAIMERLREVSEQGEVQLRLLAQVANQTKPPEGSNQNDDSWNDLKVALENGSIVRKRIERHSVASTVQTGASDDDSIFSMNDGKDGRLSGTRSSSISSDSLSKSRPQPIVDPRCLTVDDTPYFDDTTPQEVLDTLIKSLKEQVSFEIHRHQDDLAAQHLLDTIMHLDELYIGYGTMGFEEFRATQSQLRTQLTEIYIRQDKNEEATKILRENVQLKSKPEGTIVVKAPTKVDAGVTPNHAMDHYQFGLISHKQYQSTHKPLYLKAAEREAKRAFKCSLKARDADPKQFENAVSFLIRIYEDQGKMVHADTYRGLYLSQKHGQKLPGEPLDLIDAVIQNRLDYIPPGIDIELCRDGKTAIMYAVEREDVIIIRKLHHAGAKLDRAFLYAVENGKVKMTQLLLELGASTEMKDDQGATPLLIAVRCAHASIVQKLLDWRVVVDVKDKNGWSVVHFAAHRRSAEIMRMLIKLDYQVNLNAACLAGKTALHYLAEQGNFAIAEMLLQKKADAGIEDKANRTPLDIAVTRRKYDFVKILLKYNFNTFNPTSLRATSQEIRNLLRIEQTSHRSDPVTPDGHLSGHELKGLTTTRKNESSRFGRFRLSGF